MTSRLVFDLDKYIPWAKIVNFALILLRFGQVVLQGPAENRVVLVLSFSLSFMFYSLGYNVRICCTLTVTLPNFHQRFPEEKPRISYQIWHQNKGNILNFRRLCLLCGNGKTGVSYCHYNVTRPTAMAKRRRPRHLVNHWVNYTEQYGCPAVCNCGGGILQKIVSIIPPLYYYFVGRGGRGSRVSRGVGVEGVEGVLEEPENTLSNHVPKYLHAC